VDECTDSDCEIILERFKEKFEHIKTPNLTSFEKKLIGKIIKEYPILNEDYAIRYNIYLTEKDGEYSVVLRWTNILPDVESEPEIYRFNMENVEKMRDIFDDAIKTTVANPLKKKIE